MRGQELKELFASYAGVYGDRVFAFTSSASPPGFPWFTGRDQRQMIRYRARFRYPEKAAQPINVCEAEERSANPVPASAADMMIDVETPGGETFAIDDPALVNHLEAATGNRHQLTLRRSEKAMTDAFPVSIFAVQAAQTLGEEIGIRIDTRRFRANIYLDLSSKDPYAENQFVGKSLRIGQKVVVHVLQRDERCMMITLDPDTAEKTPAILKQVAQSHGNMIGLYAAVLTEGVIRKGDPVELLS